MKSVIPARKRRQFAKETRLAKVRRARKIDRILAQVFPDARAELDFTNPFELLIATVLSAQTTDVRVNQVTPELFARYPSAHTLAAATREDVEAIIRPTGFFRSKAANIIALAIQLVELYDGEVPRTQKELVKLPGVGVKTANVVLGNAFDTPGLTVDTHVGRLARRMGFTTHTDPLKVEADLQDLYDPRDLTLVSHRLIFMGRRICHARRPACGACPIANLCPSYGEGELDEHTAASLFTYGLTYPEGGWDFD